MSTPRAADGVSRRAALAGLGLAALAVLLVLPGRALAGSIIQPEPFAATFFVPCAAGGAGEDVAVTATARFFVAIERPPAGGLIVFVHSWAQGSGVGLTTGASYRYVAGSQDNEVFAPDGTTSVTVVTNARVVGRGPGEVFLVHLVSHLTVLADGTVAAAVDDATGECR
jgi:hypothetical protein